MKILIPDTQGSKLSAKYRNLLPNVTFRGIDHPDVKTHNDHGAWCGWLAGVCLQALGGHHEIVFLQILGEKGPVKNWRELIYETIQAERPDVVSCSWGSWDQGDDFAGLFLRAIYEPYAKKMLALQQELGFVLVAAAGNDDTNNERPDTAYPQAIMFDVFIIGSTNRYGIPSRFSGDGRVHAMMIGENVMSPCADGGWVLWSGTSASAPKFAGLVAANKWNTIATRNSIKTLAEFPKNYTGPRPHPKWGEGSMEWGWQQLASMLPKALRPPRAIHALNLTAVPDGRIS